MSNGNPAALHGDVGTGLFNFSRLSPADAAQPGESELRELVSVVKMADQVDGFSNHTDPEVVIPVW